MTNQLPLHLKRRRHKKRPLQTTEEVAAEEISVDAAFMAVLSEQDGILTVKEQKKKHAESISRWTTCFHFAPDRLWRKFSETLDAQIVSRPS